MKARKSEHMVTISFEPMQIPPFKDILIFTRKCPHGLHGVAKTIKLLSNDEFELVEITQDEIVEAVIINRKLIKKLGREEIIELLKIHVFPEINPFEVVKVDLSVRTKIHLQE